MLVRLTYLIIQRQHNIPLLSIYHDVLNHFPIDVIWVFPQYFVIANYAVMDIHVGVYPSNLVQIFQEWNHQSQSIRTFKIFIGIAKLFSI